jgi:hypothetical protein
MDERRHADKTSAVDVKDELLWDVFWFRTAQTTDLEKGVSDLFHNKPSSLRRSLGLFIDNLELGRKLELGVDPDT